MFRSPGRSSTTPSPPCPSTGLTMAPSGASSTKARSCARSRLTRVSGVSSGKCSAQSFSFAVRSPARRVDVDRPCARRWPPPAASRGGTPRPPAGPSASRARRALRGGPRARPRRGSGAPAGRSTSTSRARACAWPPAWNSASWPKLSSRWPRSCSRAHQREGGVVVDQHLLERVHEEADGERGRVHGPATVTEDTGRRRHTSAGTPEGEHAAPAHRQQQRRRSGTPPTPAAGARRRSPPAPGPWRRSGCRWPGGSSPPERPGRRPPGSACGEPSRARCRRTARAAPPRSAAAPRRATGGRR